jgi:hypothetical protein
VAYDLFEEIIMASSTRKSILNAIQTVLSSISDSRVYRARKEQFPALPAIVITTIEENSVEISIGRCHSELLVGISVYAKSDIPDDGADDVLKSCWDTLLENINLGLGDGVQISTTRAIKWEYDDYDLVKATLFVSIKYITSGGM